MSIIQNAYFKVDFLIQNTRTVHFQKKKRNKRIDEVPLKHKIKINLHSKSCIHVFILVCDQHFHFTTSFGNNQPSYEIVCKRCKIPNSNIF